MSRTLRRPMFRGGRVSAYGTGIAAPLVNGYKGGGQIGGGIIHGLPHADGRYGFQNPELFNIENIVPETPVGAEIVAENVSPSSYEELVAAEKFQRGTIYDEDYIQDKWTEFQNDLYTGPGDVLNLEKEFGTGMQVWPEQGVETSAVLERIKQDPDGAYQDFKSGIIGGTDYGALQKEQTAAAETSGVDLGIKTDVATELTDEQLRIQELEKALAAKAEPTDIDAKSMVAENKALFADLLGIKEGRGDDITSMLLGFAGSKGDTTMEKFQDFAAKEAVRPGRRQKIEDAAGTLAIQDYIAGKRSKEQIEKLKEVETWKLDEQIKRIVPQADDKWITAVRKAAGKDGSLSSSKTIKSALAGIFEGNIPINQDKTKSNLDEISKDQDDFEIGFTIVTLSKENGKKVIVEKTATDIKIRTDLPIF